MSPGDRGGRPSRLPYGLALSALGVVFGDIGTSPLYALRACLTAGDATQVDRVAILGVLSLIFWALALTVTTKYIVIILRADNRGEGGVLALTALAASEGPSHRYALFTGLGLAGCALFYGDGFITPAVTMLGAVEGLEIFEPEMARAVIPISVGLLLLLFKLQRRGTGALGGWFGPVMLLWFVTLGALGVRGILAEPSVLAAVNPVFALQFLVANVPIALFVIGSVFLAVTGGEALYADLGHFGITPIRMAWFGVAWPALVLNYFGQGALLLEQPDAIANPFFRLAPGWFLVPLVLLATFAAAIASQAVISGVFSMTQQALQLGFLPRLRVVQSSADAVGQVYVPSINWILCAGTITLAVAFGSSDNLANAYGIAVASTMVIETTLLLLLLQHRAGQIHSGSNQAETNNRLLFFCLMPLALIDVVFFVANAAKVPQGGWFPLVAAAGVLLMMRTWTNGRVVVSDMMRRKGCTDAQFLAQVARDAPFRTAGVAVFLTGETAGVPRTLVRNLQHNGVLHEHTVVLTIVTERVPKVSRGTRMAVAEIGHGVYRVTAHIGFMDQPEVPKLLREAEKRGLPFQTFSATYFLGRDDIVIGNPRGMPIWRKRLFLFMARNALFAGEHFGIPPERIIEIGGQVEI